MKKILITFIIMVMSPFSLFAQSYDALWKQVDEASRKDLPKTQIAVLGKIILKAQKEKSYGNLLAAELYTSSLVTLISPDSANAQKQRLVKLVEEADKRDKVQSAIYNCALGKLLLLSGGFDDVEDVPSVLENMTDEETDPDDAFSTKSYKYYFDKAIANPELLAQHKAAEYKPLLELGKDDAIYDDDLLHVIGAETGRYDVMDKYYSSTGNRQAAFLSAYNRLAKDATVAQMDSLTALYGDLPICGKAAVKKYQLAFSDRSEAKDRIAYIDDALKRWGAFSEMELLRKKRNEMTVPSFSFELDSYVWPSNTIQKIKEFEVRNLTDLKLTITRTTLEGDHGLNPSYRENLKKVKAKLIPSSAKTFDFTFPKRPEYEFTKGSFAMPKLEPGIYLVEISSSDRKIAPQYELYNVTDLFLLSEDASVSGDRFVVVNATTGQPVKGAKVMISNEYYFKRNKAKTLVTNADGEVLKPSAGERTSVYVYTDKDRALPSSDAMYRYVKGGDRIGEENIVRIFTDRSIYRPGQTVHASLMYYKMNHNLLTSRALANEELTVRLYNANYETVATKKAITDEYGAVAIDFELPKNELTGSYSISCNHESFYFSVEEYKRPTFDVEFDEYKEKYADGDTIKVKGRAKTYSGVSVQGAKVEYSINRKASYYTWYTSHYDLNLAKGEVTTDENGEFEISVPIVMPEKAKETDETGYFRPYLRFVVEAKVTDVAGESHEGDMVLPLRFKPIEITTDLPDRALRGELKQFTLKMVNAAGQSVDGKVEYAVVPYRKDNQTFGSLTAVAANKPIELKDLKSGQYELFATCEGDTLRKTFIIFSLDDKRPVLETHDWFYQSADRFPNDGKPVYIQIGSSDEDQYIIYTIYSDKKILERGAIRQSNALTTRKFTYKPEYGDGLTINYAWVKNGVMYSHNAAIRRPHPGKELSVKWKTFRDRLVPGQAEEWTLTVKSPDGKAAKARMVATLYDMSLDQIKTHNWAFGKNFIDRLTGASFSGSLTSSFQMYYTVPVPQSGIRYLSFAGFDNRYFIDFNEQMVFNRRRIMVRGAGSMDKNVMYDMAVPELAAVKKEAADSSLSASQAEPAKYGEMRGKAETKAAGETGAATAKKPMLQMRENFNETAFFYPNLETDDTGNISVKFKLPESVTTWKFMGFAHDKAINYGQIDGEVIAQKTVMVQPNLPRFVRMGDEAIVSTRIMNTSAKEVSGVATLELVDPLTDKVLYTEDKDFTMAANGTSSASFSLADVLKEGSARQLTADQNMLIVRIFAKGDGYSDGEQHYLAVLPNREYVINTYPFTQNEAGVKSIDLTKLFPKNTTNQRLTVEYTNNPNWLMIQALPYVADVNTKNAISLVSAFYANSLANKIIKTSPKIKQTIEAWRNEKGEETSMMSALQKNQDLKELALNETPWVLDANNEAEQKQMLVRFFDENQLKSNIGSSLANLKKLQNSDGSFSWWEGMRGNMYMTVSVVKTLTRLNTLMGENNDETKTLLASAFRYLDKEVAERVIEMKKLEKKGYKNIVPSDALCDYLYSNALAKRPTTADITYLISLLAKKPVDLTIYGKANTAVILKQYGQTKKAEEYLQSIKEYTVYSEEKGRYFDTRHAYYSWSDYKIPTEVAAIEAFKTIRPNDVKTVQEMQRWILQSKRTQAWDTPINSVDAIWAFMNDGRWTMDNGEASVLKLDGKRIETPKATAGLGYVKVQKQVSVNTTPNDASRESASTLTVEKTSTGTSWGAVYAQFFQPIMEIKSSNSELKVKRELIPVSVDNRTTGEMKLKVGDKVIVRLTITADRDYDFVQVIDKRAACLEPVKQFSGYQGWSGYYIAPKDYTTNFYFDQMAKGTHVVETEYYIDRAGVYQTGTCTAQCAYAPEYSGRTGAAIVRVNE